MCWITSEIVSPPEKREAKEDIIVFKIFSIESQKCGYYNTFINIVSIVSPICDFTWRLNKIEETLLDTPRQYITSTSYAIEKGFHSLDSKPEKIEYPGNSYISRWYTFDRYGRHFILGADSNEIVLKCIIPKGAIYYKNERGNVVSNKLMILSENKNVILEFLQSKQINTESVRFQ